MAQRLPIVIDDIGDFRTERAQRTANVRIVDRGVGVVRKGGIQEPGVTLFQKVASGIGIHVGVQVSADDFGDADGRLEQSQGVVGRAFVKRAVREEHTGFRLEHVFV